MENHIQSVKIDDFGKKIRDINNSNKIKFSYKIMTRENVQLHKETLYSYRQIDEKFQKISKIDLLAMKSSDAEKYFGTDAEKASTLLCFAHDKELYSALKSIFENHKTKKDSFPFKEFATEENKMCGDSFVIDFIPKREIKIKNVRIAPEVKNPEDILFKKFDTGVSNKCGYESFSWKEIHVLKTNKGKFVSLPINAKNIKFSNEKQIIDTEKYNNQIIKMNTDTKFKPIILKYGSHLIDKQTKQLYYVVGAWGPNIEIKPVWKKSEKRIPKTTNALAKEFDLCEVDAIGNIFNIKTFDI